MVVIDPIESECKLLGLIVGFQTFTQAFVMTGGGPLNSTMLYALYTYINAFTFLKMGYASALAWVMFVLILLFTGSPHRDLPSVGDASAYGVLQAAVNRELHLKRTPQLAFQYDPTVERGMRLSRLIDDLDPGEPADE